MGRGMGDYFPFFEINGQKSGPLSFFFSLALDWLREMYCTGAAGYRVSENEHAQSPNTVRFSARRELEWKQMHVNQEGDQFCLTS